MDAEKQLTALWEEYKAEKLATLKADIARMATQIDEQNKEIKQHRWIPVSKRLPENANAVLLYCDKMIVTGYFSGEWQIHNTKTPRCYYQHKITHWKPIILPEQALKDKP